MKICYGVGEAVTGIWSAPHKCRRICLDLRNKTESDLLDLTHKAFDINDPRVAQRKAPNSQFQINSSLKTRHGRPVIVIENALGCAVQIFVLPVLESPKAQRQSCQSERQRNRDQVEEVFHSANRSNGSFRPKGFVFPCLGSPFSLNALATTTMDDSDIASAATNGVA